MNNNRKDFKFKVPYNKYVLIFLILIVSTSQISAQKDYYQFNYKQLIIPTALITIGAIGVKSDWWESRNMEMREELTEDIDKKLTIDDFSQYSPAAAVYGLNLLGIKGRHNFEDRTIILATSYLLMGITVNSLKYIIKEKRPDGSNNKSFPSGHTATAFMGAEFLRREYKDISPWIGIAGYTVAAGTGFFRMYNNRHWCTDVITGAGIGILSADAGYWLFPEIEKKIFKKNLSEKITFIPYYNSGNTGISFKYTF